MSLTFSLRKEIVEVVPMVSEVLKRWPALSLPNEVKVLVLTGSNEFKHITNVDLLCNIQLIITPTYTTSSEITSNIVNHRNIVNLPEDPALFRKCLSNDYGIQRYEACVRTHLQQTDRQTRGMKMGIPVLTEDDVAPSTLPTFTNFAVVLEEILY
ncbi:Dynein beta chain, flagellar outer arm [Labeo rohita]|uniref:Dynein beta chain, flagellar outer arm n=1 Tax=Labeo rohita TaxID=84645 RepID=A0ABQ8L3W9_LABRO|nr:Dynein beta chain, flagellar outer arm [Labeo rohita]